MRFPKIKWPWVAVSLALGVAALFGGNWLWQTMGVNKPLAARLGEIPGVAAADFGRPGQTLRLTLAPDADLPAAVQEASRVTAEAIPGWSGEVEIANADGLTGMARPFSLLAYEAAATGRFSAAADEVARRGREAGLDRAELSVDARRVYLSLVEGDRRFDLVIRRPPMEAVGEANGW